MVGPTREELLEQLGRVASDQKGRKILDLVLDIVAIDAALLKKKLLSADEWDKARFYQGGARALDKLTGLNGEIQRAMKPTTPEG